MIIIIIIIIIIICKFGVLIYSKRNSLPLYTDTSINGSTSIPYYTTYWWRASACTLQWSTTYIYAIHHSSTPDHHCLIDINLYNITAIMDKTGSPLIYLSQITPLLHALHSRMHAKKAKLIILYEILKHKHSMFQNFYKWMKYYEGKQHQCWALQRPAPAKVILSSGINWLLWLDNSTLFYKFYILHLGA